MGDEQEISLHRCMFGIEKGDLINCMIWPLLMP
jgi:hypothetical protein